MTDILLESTISCPACSHRKTEAMPTNACQWFCECEACRQLLSPPPRDCRVFCSHAGVKCPPIQQTRVAAIALKRLLNSVTIASPCAPCGSCYTRDSTN